MAEDPRTLHIRQGITYRASFTWEDANNAPVPLTGRAAIFRLLRRAGGTVLLSVSSDTGEIAIEPGGATGEMDLRLGADQTAPFKRDCVYEMTVPSISDPTEVAYIASGPVVVFPMGD